MICSRVRGPGPARASCASADPDVLWNMEVFHSREAKDAYENSPLADELRDEIIGLPAEPPMRIEVHPCSALPADPT